MNAFNDSMITVDRERVQGELALSVKSRGKKGCPASSDSGTTSEEPV